jgi:hypothetical protein
VIGATDTPGQVKWREIPEKLRGAAEDLETVARAADRQAKREMTILAEEMLDVSHRLEDLRTRNPKDPQPKPHKPRWLGWLP